MRRRKGWYDICGESEVWPGFFDPVTWSMFPERGVRRWIDYLRFGGSDQGGEGVQCYPATPSGTATYTPQPWLGVLEPGPKITGRNPIGLQRRYSGISRGSPRSRHAYCPPSPGEQQGQPDA
ncbi:hypothetical protein LIER_16262 [Lithospermum erythrorhizon]|uniref:Uncharacterized protein n=1 Tax=Lithospermum erythrorhizon TaxID=34254 RepID=A0AAV3Q7V8_LITER